MLDTIRQLTQSIKLKDIMIANFIPEESTKSIEKRAVWSAEEDRWTVSKIDFETVKTRLLRQGPLYTDIYLLVL